MRSYQVVLYTGMHVFTIGAVLQGTSGERCFCKVFNFLIGNAIIYWIKKCQCTFPTVILNVFPLQYPHRWNIIQVREFVPIFSVLSYLLRYTNISHHETDRTLY